MDDAVDDASDDAVTDYERAGFRGRLGWGTSPAVVVIDLCHAYLDPTSPLYAGIEDAVASAVALVAGARDRGIPVIFTRVEVAPGGLDGGLFYLKVPALKLFERGHPLAAFLDDPAPRPGEVVVTKQYASAFFGTSLGPTLLRMGIDTVVLCGVSTSGCVRATGNDALQYGFRPIVVGDACGDRSRRQHDANLFDLEAHCADVVTTADVLAHFDALLPEPVTG